MPPNNFSIVVDWAQTERADAHPEDYCIGELNVTADGAPLAKNKDRELGNEKECALVSALPFARWAASSFWRILYEPGPLNDQPAPVWWRMAHEMTSIGEGWAWPHIAFTSDTCQVRIIAHGQSEVDSSWQRARYTASGEWYIPLPEMREGLRNFITEVKDRLSEAGRAPEITDELNERLAEDRDDGARNYRIIEAMLGYDPGYGPAPLMRKFCDLAERRVDMAILMEIAGGLNPLAGLERNDQFSGLERAYSSMKSGVKATLKLPHISRPSAREPWDYGQQLARDLRRQYGLSCTEGIDQKCLLDFFRLTRSQFQRVPSAGAVSLCKKYNDRLSISFKSMRSCSSFYMEQRRFQLGRILGAYLASAPHAKWLALSDGSTWEQQMQRNFACEFLAPLDGILAMIPTEPNDLSLTQVQKIAKHFEVTPFTLINSLMNNHKMDRESAERLLKAA
ncbi:MAG: hypothetical protein HDQ92_04815 [Desulfovibrio sp.]|nr:hypothetical protein [Desulfovibrio sp.]